MLDYLIEEVLEQQSDSVQSFLLQTAVLKRMNSALCDAVTGQNDSQVILETLEHANLFIVPLDEARIGIAITTSSPTCCGSVCANPSGICCLHCMPALANRSPKTDS